MRIKVFQVDTRAPRQNADGLSPDLVFPDTIRKHADISREFVRANRQQMSIDYWSLSSRLNEFLCRKKDWDYEYQVATHTQPNHHVMWVKTWETIQQLDAIKDTNIDILVVFDTDMWIRDEDGFEQVLRSFHNDPAKAFLFAGEPPEIAEAKLVYVPQSINGGFMCLKNCQDSRDLMRNAWRVSEADPNCMHYMKHWPFDQTAMNHMYHYGDGVKDKSMVLDMLLCNTPAGKLVRHCWPKDMANGLLLLDMHAALGRHLAPPAAQNNLHT